MFVFLCFNLLSVVFKFRMLCKLGLSGRFYTGLSKLAKLELVVCFNMSVGQLFKEFVVQWHHLKAAEVCYVARRHAIVVEEPPSALVADDAVMRSPTDDWL